MFYSLILTIILEEQYYDDYFRADESEAQRV